MPREETTLAFGHIEGPAVQYNICYRRGLIAVIAVLLAFAVQPARAQLRDSFEGPERTWQIAKEADCGVRVLGHDRPYRESHTGQACEHFRLVVGNGTFLPLVHSVGRIPVIQEFRPRLFVKSDRPGLQLMVRVVFPRNIDRGTGQPITSLLRGDMYTEVGQWQQLMVRDGMRLLEQETRHLRTQFGSDIDPREAFVDLVVLNAYSAPGAIEVWIDDLEIDGYIDLGDTSGPQVARRTASGPGAAPEAEAAAAANVQGSLLMIRSRPQMPRAIQHRGEPLEWLRSLGFNTVKLSASPSPAELKECQRLGLWLIAPPPYQDQAQPENYDAVIAWSLGSRLTERDLAGTRNLATEVRNFDRQRDRPLLIGADSGLAQYSRLGHMLVFERPTLGTTQELAESRGWALAQARLARPGTPTLATIDCQRSPRLNEQVLLLGGGATWEEDVDPEQIRLAAFQALAAGARGVVVRTEKPLTIDTPSAALRTDAVRLLNYELRLLEPWIAAGQLTEELAAGDGTVQVSVLTIDRSRLLLITQHGAGQQYVMGPPPRSALSVVVPGLGIADKAYLITLAGLAPLKVSHASTGSRITIDDASHAAAIVVTQDHLAMHHLYRTLAEIKEPACRLQHDVASRRLGASAQLDRRLTELGHPLANSAALLQQATENLQQGAQIAATGDFQRADPLRAKGEQLVAKLRRGHWEQSASAFPSPAASPCVAQFTTLPLHWTLAAALQARPFGPNAQAGGDMESLDQMLKAGWQQQRLNGDDVATDLTLSLSDPHAGRTALRLQAWPTDPKRVPVALERPPVVVTSSAVPVRQSQIARIHGWVNVPRQLAASSEGLLVFDSLGGRELADRIRLTQGWREFTLYRAVPQTGELTVTFALTGLGEASIDDLSVSLLDPEPIKPR
jgi:hypothetical protein